MKLLVLAFRGTIAQHIADDLTIPAHTVLIESDKDWISQWVARIDFREWDYILAMGEYTGRDQESLRIETSCSSQFRNDTSNLRNRVIPYFFKPTAPFKLAHGMGNSWCNVLAFQILTCPYPPANFTFLHVPSRWDAADGARAISRQWAG